jgi:hypothetical protein
MPSRKTRTFLKCKWRLAFRCSSSERSRAYLCDFFQELTANSATSSGIGIAPSNYAICPVEKSIPSMSCTMMLIVGGGSIEASTKTRAWCVPRTVCLRSRFLARTGCLTSTDVLLCVEAPAIVSASTARRRRRCHLL